MCQQSTLTTGKMIISLKKQQVGGLDFGPASFIHRTALIKSYNYFSLLTSLTANATQKKSQPSTEVPTQCLLLTKMLH